jgi:hypothetical protein
MNPFPPYVRVLVKICKPDAPIRPIINWVDASPYRLAKKLVKVITTYIPLPFAYNVKNSIHLMNDLSDIPWEPDLCLASFDISNMYTNIPTDRLSSIINLLCEHNNVDPLQKTELLQLYNVVLAQNYFTFLPLTTYKTMDWQWGHRPHPFFQKVMYSI